MRRKNIYNIYYNGAKNGTIEILKNQVFLSVLQNKYQKNGANK